MNKSSLRLINAGWYDSVSRQTRPRSPFLGSQADTAIHGELFCSQEAAIGQDHDSLYLAQAHEESPA